MHKALEIFLYQEKLESRHTCMTYTVLVRDKTQQKKRTFQSELHCLKNVVTANREIAYEIKYYIAFFQEFLFFVLPLINFQRLKNFVIQKFLSSSTTSSRSLDTKRDYTTCAACGEWPIRAQEFGCPHVFCYFCLQVKTYFYVQKLVCKI
jgi:hypothetical protein